MTNIKHKEIANKGLWGGSLIGFESLPSTNRWILDPANDCRHGDVIYTKTQTAGRGRFSRKWHTPKNTCLTISIVIQPDSTQALPASFLTQYAAIAIRTMLSRYNINAMLKWPNDVYVSSRKIAGILAEHSTFSNRIALGIGLNVNMNAKDFANIELRQPATSMATETGQNYCIDTICLALISAIKVELTNLQDFQGTSLSEKWQEHDYLHGKNIHIETSNNSMQGLYSGIDEEGRLIITDNTGKTHLFWSGDISLSLQ